MEKSLQGKAISIKGKQYVLVSDRILYFNETYPNGYIQTKLITEPDAERVVVRATIVPDADKPERKFVDYSQAKWGDGFINQSSAIENCSTSAVGRCMAYMGIGVIDSVASVDEINKAEIQGKMMSSDKLKQISEALDEKGIKTKADKRKMLVCLRGGDTSPLNTSGAARLLREIREATVDTLQDILINYEGWDENK